jgi:hypothetical protein
MDVDRVLNELETLDPRKCRMVEFRFFLGFTAEETNIHRFPLASVHAEPFALPTG